MFINNTVKHFQYCGMF